MRSKWSFCAGFAAALVLGGVAVALDAGPARALDEIAGEKEALKECEKRLCEIVVNKAETGGDLSCPLSKTWLQAKIKDGVEKRRLTWAFGDARCKVELNAKRETLVGAVTKPEHSLELQPHVVNCEIERDSEVTPINISLAPKILFKNGKAEKAWLNVTSVEGPSVVKGAIWAVARVEDSVGLFHSDMISEINEFVEKKCPRALAKN